MKEAPTPRIIIISGPSGVGKSTIVRKLLTQCELSLSLSVSATTRPPRNGERDGADYYFLSRGEFLRRQAAGEFLESCEVFESGDWYGTLRSEVDRGLQAGRSVILEIDVRGAQAVIAQRDDVVTFFIRPASLAVLETRLRDRATEPEGVIQRRLERSRREMAAADQYDYQVTNERLDEAVQEMCRLLKDTIV